MLIFQGVKNPWIFYLIPWLRISESRLQTSWVSGFSETKVGGGWNTLDIKSLKPPEVWCFIGMFGGMISLGTTKITLKCLDLATKERFSHLQFG